MSKPETDFGDNLIFMTSTHKAQFAEKDTDSRKEKTRILDSMM